MCTEQTLFHYVDVIIPLSLTQTYTYRVHTEVSRGCRVIVPLGNRKLYTGVVLSTHNSPTHKENIKDVVEVIDQFPLIGIEQLNLWEWIAQYYMTTLGEVMRVALPSTLRLGSEMEVLLINTPTPDTSLSLSEQKVLDALAQNKQQTIGAISRKIGEKTVPIMTIRKLIEREIVVTVEKMTSNDLAATPQKISYLTVSSKEEIEKHLMNLSKTASQQRIVLEYILRQLSTQNTDVYKETTKSVLEHTKVAFSVIKALIKKNIIKELVVEHNPYRDGIMDKEIALPVLSPAQTKALCEIKKNFLTSSICLLHGVTGSGKTELYTHLIFDELKQGNQVLYLLPEIALTTQLTTRLRAIFGTHLLVYHSKLSDREREKTWQVLHQEKTARVVLGVRSSIFLPFTNLSLIVVDEEHDSSYKQDDPSPRYHARSTSLMLAKYFGAKTLLGSATPSIESYYWSQQGKYALVHLTSRYNNIPLPHLEVQDTKELRRTKQMSSKIYSPYLLEVIEDRINKREQTLLLRNRRGFSPFMECRLCAYVPQCAHCDVSLTYHKRTQQLVCHYCGSVYTVIKDCPQCKQIDTVIEVGFGTEQAEEELQEYFPQAQIARLDQDTTRSKTRLKTIVQQLSQGEVDILVGTQMIAKGLDFDKVTLVGILQADSLLNRPDFRAGEKTFQLLEQMAGRAGRRLEQGLVVLQTSKPTHPVIQDVCAHDYLSFYQREIADRKKYSYPPFVRLFVITLRHKMAQNAHVAALLLSKLLLRLTSIQVLGPISPPVARIRGLYAQQIMLKVFPEQSITQVRKQISDVLNHFRTLPEAKQLILSIDVDPS